MRSLAVMSLLMVIPLAAAQQISVREALATPFMNQLTAAPAKNRIAWFTDEEGRRNIWVASPTEPAHSITHNTQDDGQDISNITWSPDAQSVAYTHGTGSEGSTHPTAADPAQLQTGIRQQVEIATITGEVKTIGEGHAPTFSTDGKHLFYLLHGRILSADLTTNTPPQQLLEARGTASALRPSPDGTKLAFVSNRGDHSFIGVYTFATKTVQYIDPSTGLDHDPAWSPDSKRIAFIRESPVATELNLRWMREGVPWSIRIANATTGEGTEAWRADKGAGSLFHEVSMKSQLLWMADGRLIFPWEKTGWVHLYSLLPGKRQAEELTPGDFEVDNAVTDGERIVYSSNQVDRDSRNLDRRHLWSVTSAANPPERLSAADALLTEPALLTDGSVGAMRGGATQPLTPVLIGPAPQSPQGGPLAQTCFSTGRPFDPNLGCPPARILFRNLATFNRGTTLSRRFVEPQQIVFPATDGTKIHAQLFLPKDTKPGTKLPAIVFFHGGSRRQMLLGYNPMQYYAQAYEFNQVLASHGYAVLSVNYRSGTGYGLNFRQAKNYGPFGASEYTDVKGAALYLQSRADIDPKRIGAWGGSYGGYLTALALARNSDLFAAGVDLHGVHDYAMELELENPNNDHTVDAKAMEETAWQSSPMADIAKWKSPVLLIQGDDDREVMFSNTVRLAAALREHNVEVEEKIFPDEVHDFLLHRDWIAAYEAALDFFDRKLKAKQ